MSNQMTNQEIIEKWLLLNKEQQEELLPLLTQEQKEALWLALNSTHQASLWQGLRCYDQANLWLLLNKEQQAKLWQWLTQEQQEALWLALNSINQAKLWQLLNKEQQTNFWCSLTDYGRTELWDNLTEEDQEALDLDINPHLLSDPWHELDQEEQEELWQWLTQEQQEALWLALNSTHQASLWQEFNSEQQAKLWQELTQEQQEELWQQLEDKQRFNLNPSKLLIHISEKIETTFIQDIIPVIDVEDFFELFFTRIYDETMIPNLFTKYPSLNGQFEVYKPFLEWVRDKPFLCWIESDEKWYYYLNHYDFYDDHLKTTYKEYFKDYTREEVIEAMEYVVQIESKNYALYVLNELCTTLEDCLDLLDASSYDNFLIEYVFRAETMKQLLYHPRFSENYRKRGLSLVSFDDCHAELDERLEILLAMNVEDQANCFMCFDENEYYYNEFVLKQIVIDKEQFIAFWQLITKYEKKELWQDLEDETKEELWNLLNKEQQEELKTS